MAPFSIPGLDRESVGAVGDGWVVVAYGFLDPCLGVWYGMAGLPHRSSWGGV